MATDKIKRDDQVEDKIFDIGKDYSKSLQVAIDANDEWVASFAALKKVALEYIAIDKQFKQASGRSEFNKAKKEEEQVRKLAAQALKAEEDALKKSIEVKGKLLDNEKKLLDIEAKKERAKRISTKLTIEERLERTRANRVEKDEAILKSKTSTLMDILNVKRRRAASIVQDLTAKKKLGNQLSNVEQKELKESTIQFNRYDLAIRKAKETTRQFQENVGNYPKQFGIARGAIAKLLPLIGGMLTLRAAFNFGKEARELANEAKGVEFAFQRIEQRTKSAQKTFEDVKASTRGLLSDLDIKKSIVEFDNFNLSAERLDDLLGFVSVTAAQTGKDFDYLKDSLVEGISKESKLRLDNLGISATELNAELEKTPDFLNAVANIAERKVKAAGDILGEAANAQQKWNADLKNFQVLVGDRIVSRFSDALFSAGSAMLNLITPTKRMSDAVKEQQLELNILVQKITATNVGEQERADKIDQLQKKYPGFLKNLDAEKTSNEEIRDRLKEVNKAYIVKIALTDLEQDITETSAKAGEKLSASFKLEERARKSLIEAIGLTETNRLLETRTLKQAADQAARDLKITDEAIKAEGRGIRILNEKQKAVVNVQNILKSSNQFEQKSNEITKEASELEERRNRFLEKYKDILADINAITGEGETGGGDKELTDEQKKEIERLRQLAEARRKANLESKFNIESFGLQQRIADLQRLAESEKESFDVRKAAIYEIADVELELAELTATKKLAIENKFSADEISNILNGGQITNETRKKIKDDELLIIAEFNAKKKDIEREGENGVDNIDIEKFKANAEIKKLALEKQMDDEIALANEALSAELRVTKDREKSIDEHEKKVAEIKRYWAVAALNEQVAAVEKLLEAEEISAQKRAELERELSAIKLQISEITTEDFLARDEKETLSAKEKTEQILDMAQQLATALIDLANAIFDARIQKIDEEIEANEDKTSRYLENEHLTDEQKAEIEAKAEQRRKELEDKKRKEQRKQAILNKAMALVDVGIATALGIMQSYAQLGPIAGSVGAVLVGVLGAIQTAAIIAKPIPKYAMGTKNHPGGDALVGEVRPEVISEPGKEPYIVSKPTILNLPERTVVTPSVAEYRAMERASAIQEISRNHQKVLSFNETHLNVNNDEMINEMRLTREAYERKNMNVNLQTQKVDIPHALFAYKNIKWE